MLDILFHPEVFASRKTGGIVRYFTELMAALPEHGARPCLPFFVQPRAHKGAPSGLQLPYWLAPNPVRLKVAEWSVALVQNRYRVLHGTYYFASPPTSPIPCVVTIHDMIPEIFPDLEIRWAKLSVQKQLWCERADHIICVSETTKRDLQRLWGVGDSKITTVHSGCPRVSPFASTGSAPVGPVPAAPAPTFLYVGRRDIYKNFGLLVLAISRARARGLRCRLVAFGESRPTDDELSHIAQCGLTEYVRFVSGSDDDLGMHYREATALVVPSLYEGFGLPVLEAMSHGCAVIISDTPALVEVAGDAARHFRSGDADSLAEVLLEVGGDDALRESLIEKGAERCTLFSWQRCAEQTAAIYRSLANE